MFTKVMLNDRLSRTTVGRLHRYLFDFGQGAHRVFWVGDRPFLETDCPEDITLLKTQFPRMIASEAMETRMIFRGEHYSQVKEKKLGKTQTRKVATPQIVEREHGRYLIKAGRLQNKVVARAFPKPPSKFRHLVAEDTGETVEDAIRKLIEQLETLRTERRAIRRADPAIAGGVPTPEEYADALRSLSPSPRVLGVLHDHALARRRGMQLKELITSAEFSSERDLLNAYEKLGTEIARVIEPDESLQTGLPIVLVMADDPSLPPEGAVSLQPELQDAILRLLGTERRAE